jgi:hypothetical protein
MLSPRLAAALVLTALAAPLGCSPDVTTATGDTGTTGTPPASDAGPACAPGPPTGTASVTFALTRLYLGNTRRDGTVDGDAWKTYGFDLDGQTSTPASTDVCQSWHPGSSKLLWKQDGEGGLDNAFGFGILPVLLGLQPGLAQEVNDALAQGTFTLLLAVDALGATGDQAPLRTRAYRASALGGVPKLDGSDAWPVRAASLADPADPASALEQFPAGSLCHDTWGSGPGGDLTLDLVLSGVPFPLRLHHARVSMELDPGHHGAVNGTIGGIVDPAEVLYTVAVTLEPALCLNGAASQAYASLSVQLTSVADILLDGTQDPQQTCNGVTIGLGFDAHRARLGPVDDTPPPAPPCPVP